jgi:hypothetical protein
MSRRKATVPIKRAIFAIFFIGTKLLVLDVLPHKQKFNQNHFLAMIAPELSKQNPNAKGRIGKNQLMDTSTSPYAIMDANSRVFCPENNGESPSSSLPTRSITV